MTVQIEPNGPLAELATALALELQLGLLDGEGRLQHSPLALLPWPVSGLQWQQACRVARAVGQRLVALAGNDQALAGALAPILAGSSLPARLFRVLQEVDPSRRRALPVNMMRVDLLLDVQQQWKLVEANTIAAGMGPFSEGLIQLQQSLWPALQQAGVAGDPPHWLPDPVTAALAAALIEAAQAVADNDSHPLCIAFVVEPHEDNIFDHRKLARALEQRGAKVVRLTLTQLAARLDRSREPQLWVQGLGRVHALYFRTGYNPQDYLDPHGQTAPLLRLRAELETLHVALAPTIALQVASAKAVQVCWYQQAMQDAAFHALDTPQQFLSAEFPPDMDWRDWLLKSQGEGGGNVVQGSAIADRIASLSAQERQEWLLMHRIRTVPRPGFIPVLRRGHIRMMPAMVSELGVFITGRDLQASGYLVRSKPEQALETGVHRGEGCIDVLALGEG